MNTYTARSFGVSVLLHSGGIVLLCAVWATTRPTLSLPANEIFTLVAANDRGAVGQPVSTGLQPIRVAVPKPPPPAIAPAEAVAEARSTSATAPRERISLDDFRARHPNVIGPVQRGEAPTVARVSESVSFETPQGGSPANAQNELSFVPGLLADLQSALERTGITRASRQANLEFTLGTGGGLMATRILRSSGSPEFDAAVLTAAATVRVKGFSAAAVGKRYAVTFRTRDE